jgi:hypothetical protein
MISRSYLLVALIVFYASLAGILVYTQLLISTNIPVIWFHALFILATTTSAILVLSSRLSRNVRLTVIISWILTLQLMTPLRLPDDVLSNYPDPWYLKQLVGQILVSNSVILGHATGEAYLYSFYPIAQLFISICVVVTHIDPITLMKFLTIVMSIPFLLMIFSLFRHFISDNDALVAMQISGSCFWFINYLSYPVQSAFGVFFGAILLLSVFRKGPSWTIVFAIGTIALALSHLLSSFYVIFLLVTAKAYMTLQEGPWRSFGTSKVIFIVGVVFAWMFYPAVLVPQSLSDILRLVLLYELLSTTRFALVGSSVTTNPLATRIAGDAGVILYGVLLLVAFLYLRFRSETAYARILPYAIGGAVVFVIHVIVFSLGVTFAIDILPRGFFFVYLVGSPLAVFALRHRWRRASNSAVRADGPAHPHCGHKLVHSGTAYFLTCVALILILLPSMYYYYPAFRYDNSMPMNNEDVRLPLEQWKTAGDWSSAHVGTTDLYGDKLAFDFVGSLGNKEIILFPSQGNLIDWLRSNDLAGRIILLRVSSFQAPYANFRISTEQFQTVAGGSNLIYNGGDPLFIVIIGPIQG